MQQLLLIAKEIERDRAAGALLQVQLLRAAIVGSLTKEGAREFSVVTQRLQTMIGSDGNSPPQSLKVNRQSMAKAIHSVNGTRN